MTKKLLKTALLTGCIILTTSATAQQAKSEKHAIKATELRQSVFSLLGSNMGPLGAMAKGKMPFDKAAIEKHATRINQLSFMIDDYTKTNTSSYKVKTDALEKVWTERSAFEKRINDLSQASKQLLTIAQSGNESEIKRAIAGVGKTCGGCHDNFKAD